MTSNTSASPSSKVPLATRVSEKSFDFLRAGNKETVDQET